MKGLMIIIRKEKLDDVKRVLLEYGGCGMTVCDAFGCGKLNALSDIEGLEIKTDMSKNVRILSKYRVDVIVEDKDVDNVINCICETAATGRHGDGKIFVYDVVDAVRIRTKERGEKAL